MANVVEPLILDLLDWLDRGQRRYAEVMEIWRTSCPRLPVWEDAVDRGLVARLKVDGEVIVKPSPAGRRLLRADRGQSSVVSRDATKDLSNRL
jgi:hypothetical protein